MREEKTTDLLNNALLSTNENNFDEYLSRYSGNLVDSASGFTEHMRNCFVKHNRQQKDVFIAAFIPEKYGYSLISGEKHTRQRDTIIKLCLCGHFTIEETDCALKLYGMSSLYPRIARDACLIVAFNSKMFEISDVNEMLIQHGFEPLYESMG